MEIYWMKTMKKSKKITFRDSLIIINQKCDVNNVLYYIKTNMIRAPLEVAITLFLMESMIIFTKFFINDLLMAQEMILIIFQPLLAGALICFFYLIGITYYTIKKIAMVAQNMTINKSAIKNY